jgi:uncharacterized BrkB/YihY/UPF0761 family membrane protein
VKALRRAGRLLWDAFDRFNRNDGSAMAGSIAFSGLLSMFPFLIFAATLIGMLVGQDACSARKVAASAGPARASTTAGPTPRRS